MRQAAGVRCDHARHRCRVADNAWRTTHVGRHKEASGTARQCNLRPLKHAAVVGLLALPMTRCVPRTVAGSHSNARRQTAELARWCALSGRTRLFSRHALSVLRSSLCFLAACCWSRVAPAAFCWCLQALSRLTVRACLGACSAVTPIRTRASIMQGGNLFWTMAACGRSFRGCRFQGRRALLHARIRLFPGCLALCARQWHMHFAFLRCRAR